MRFRFWNFDVFVLDLELLIDIIDLRDLGLKWIYLGNCGIYSSEFKGKSCFIDVLLRFGCRVMLVVVKVMLFYV